MVAHLKTIAAAVGTKLFGAAIKRLSFRCMAQAKTSVRVMYKRF